MTTDTAFETCILCDAVTTVKITTPVEERDGYIEGAGQCCRSCFEKVLAELYYLRPLQRSTGESLL